jgi:phosphatidylglycerophosphate synthase
VIDAPLRRLAGPSLDRAGRRLAALGVRPLWVTAAGWVVGVGACVAAGCGAWAAALVLWLGNRVLDGLDGPVARVAGATRRGAFADVMADFSVYGGFVVGVAVDRPDARLACACLLVAYHVSGTAFLVVSSLVERDVAGGLAEGAETVVAYIMFCLAPGHAAAVAWTFTAVVAVTALQRVAMGLRR